MAWREQIGVVLGLILPVLFGGCSPLGKPIDADISPSYFYGKTGRSVIYCSMGNWLKAGRTPVEADRATFEPLGPNVAVDKDRVYYKYHPQPHIDRQTFEVDRLVWRDQETVYYPQSYEPLLASIDGVDAKSFEVLFPDDVNPRKWARDAHRYYLYFEPVDVDAKSFRFLNNAFVADKNLIYRNDRTLRPEAPVTAPIEVLNRAYLRMGNQILSRGPTGYETLDFDSIDDLRQINDRVLVINEQIYEWGQPFSVDDVDISTFEGWPDNNAYARDAEHVYFIFNRSFRIDGAHRNSFEPFEEYGAYARDAKHVYYEGRILEDADWETFEIAFHGDSPYARDKNGRFFMGSRQQ